MRGRQKRSKKLTRGERERRIRGIRKEARRNERDEERTRGRSKGQQECEICKRREIEKLEKGMRVRTNKIDIKA